MSDYDYKAAYERQKRAREAADKLLEDKSSELHEANATLVAAYNRLKHQKAQLLHQEKLASIGHLSAGVAHEINNPSAYVKSNLSTLEKHRQALGVFFQSLSDQVKISPVTEEEVKVMMKENDIDYIMEDYADIISDSILGMERIAGIVRGLKDFSRPDENTKNPFCVNDCIKGTLKLVWNELKYKAEIVENYGDLPVAKGYAGGFSQVILNLLVNASHAIETRGTISITTLVEEEFIVVRIADTGKGIEPQNLDRIFDPFFSTKDTGKGTGLGLSISHGIIKKHGGVLEVQSNLGEGSCFSIRLPISSK